MESLGSPQRSNAQGAVQHDELRREGTWPNSHTSQNEAVHAWLAGALKDQRDELERMHETMLVELRQKQVGQCTSSSRGAMVEVVAKDGSPMRMRMQEPPEMETNADADADAESNEDAVVPDHRVPQLSAAPQSGNAPVHPLQTLSSHSFDEAIRTTNLFAADHGDDDAADDVALSEKLSAIHTAMFAEVHKEESESLVQRLVRSPWFELFFSVMILLNVVLMILEVQYKGLKAAHEIPDFEPRGDGGKDAVWPGASDAIEAMGVFFGVIFTLEIVLRVSAQRLSYLRDAWNLFDATLVMFWYLEVFFQDVKLPVDAFLLRLLRLARLLRLLRLANKMRGFDSLWLMITVMRRSFSMLLWAFVLLTTVQVFFALALNQVILLAYFEVNIDDLDDPSVLETYTELYQYFGTFTRALLSCFEITIGNWVPVARILMESVSEYFILFSLLHRLVFGLGMINVINSVFIQETLKVAATDDILMLQRKAESVKIHDAKMKRLFSAATKRDSHVSPRHLFHIFHDPKVSQWLSAMDFDVNQTREAGELFELIKPRPTRAHGIDESAPHPGVSVEELARGVSKLKGPARSLDLALLGKRVSSVDAKLTMLLQDRVFHASRAMDENVASI